MIRDNFVIITYSQTKSSDKLKTNDLFKHIANHVNTPSEVQLRKVKFELELSKKSLKANQVLASLDIAFLLNVGVISLLVRCPLPIQPLNIVK